MLKSASSTGWEYVARRGSERTPLILGASLQHRFSRWSQGLFQVNYTYGQALDEVSNGGLFGFTFGTSVTPQDARNLRGSYGPAEYDVRHSFV